MLWQGLFTCMLGQSKLKLAVFSFHAAHRNLSSMKIDDGAHNVQAQSSASLVLAAGFIRFIKPVKDVGYTIGLNLRNRTLGSES